LGVIQTERKMTCATGDLKAPSSRRCHTFSLSRNLTSSEQLGIDPEKNYNFAHLPIDFVK
jgi:hypothetical protein